MYNYHNAIKADIIEAIKENRKYWDGFEEMSAYEKVEFLNDNLWCDDSVTGNASGSYTFNAYKAEENLVGNRDLIRDLIDEFCIDSDTVASHIDDPEYWDVSIRCHLLYSVIAEVVEEME